MMVLKVNQVITMRKLNLNSLQLQRGAAVLVTSIILLIGVTLVVIYASRVGVMDQKISGNEYRHKIAFANAEAGLDQAASYLRANPALHDDTTAGWRDCTTPTDITAIFPCNIAGATMVFDNNTTGTTIDSAVEILPAGTLPNIEAYLVKTATSTIAVGQGTTTDGTGAAVAQVSYAKTSLIKPGELPPLMVPSGDLSGNFNIVPNPNGGGPGVPISVWAKTTLNTTGANWKTCDMGEFKDGSSICMDDKGDGVTGDDWQSCSCDVERSNSTDVNSDIVLDDAADFPVSPFVYVFGNEDDGDTLGPTKIKVMDRAEANNAVFANCTNLISDFSSLVKPLVWITGDCLINAGTVVGSRDKPIILVVEGEIRINAGAEVWGIIVGLDEFVLNGGPVIHGSAISDIESDLTNGTYSQVYDKSVFDNLTDDTVNTDIAKVRFSWRDFTP